MIIGAVVSLGIILALGWFQWPRGTWLGALGSKTRESLGEKLAFVFVGLTHFCGGMQMMAHRSQTPSTVMGLILVILGVFLFFAQWMGAGFWAWTWPLSIIMVGLLFFGGMVVSGRQGGGLAIPGSIITTVGLILLFQNLTGRFETWSYVWALIPAAVGVGIAIDGVWSDRPEMIRSGWRLMGIGAILFVAGFVFFEMTLNIGGRWGGGGTFVGPLLLIGIGLYALVRGIGRGQREAPSDMPESTPDIYSLQPEPGPKAGTLWVPPLHAQRQPESPTAMPQSPVVTTKIETGLETQPLETNEKELSDVAR